MAKLRRVRKYGNTWVIVLAPSDAKQNNITDKGWADIEDCIFASDENAQLNKKEE